MTPLRIVVMGTTDFALPALNALVEAGHKVVTVVCQPDRPNARGKKIKYLPMKARALELGIPVFQPEKIKTPEAVETLRSLKADLFVVAAYGQILSEEILYMPTYHSVNIHGSLLPKYRGAAPIHHAIMDGMTETGVTLMKMDIGMDTGDMLAKTVVPITETSTVGEIHDTLAQAGATLLVETIPSMVAGTVKAQKQDEAQATYADKVEKTTGCVNWNRETAMVIRQINGTDPFPGAYTTVDGAKMKCYRPLPVSGKGEPGTILSADTKEGLVVATLDGALAITQIQMPGKKRMASQDYFRGNAMTIGEHLG